MPSDVVPWVGIVDGAGSGSCWRVRATFEVALVVGATLWLVDDETLMSVLSAADCEKASACGRILDAVIDIVFDDGGNGASLLEFLAESFDVEVFEDFLELAASVFVAVGLFMAAFFATPGSFAAPVACIPGWRPFVFDEVAADKSTSATASDTTGFFTLARFFVTTSTDMSSNFLLSETIVRPRLSLLEALWKTRFDASRLSGALQKRSCGVQGLRRGS